MNTHERSFSAEPRRLKPPRLGFLGVGWIGRSRMEAMLRAGAGEAVAFAEPAAQMREAALALAPDAVAVDGLDALLAMEDIDGIVIATPSALHAGQSIRALERGKAVFCQKPLGRDAAEVAQVVNAARANDLLLGVDLSYRFTAGLQAIRQRLKAGESGRIFAAELVFHNAYGPDKPWFYDVVQSGGGCLIDLGTHLADAALWMLGYPQVRAAGASLFHQGIPLSQAGNVTEDYAEANLALADGTAIRLSCSWGLHAGRDAVISAVFHGTKGALAFRNVGGSFYDFTAEQWSGTTSTVLTQPPDDWSGRAAIDWARRLGRNRRFDADAGRLVDLAKVLDGIYEAGGRRK